MAAGVGTGRTIPILRIFDEAKAREFYVDFLGFKIDFEHLHLSEHHGDATPGSAARIHTENLDALHAELAAKKYKYYRPGIQQQPWGRDMSVTDPFGNRLIFTDVRPARS